MSRRLIVSTIILMALVGFGIWAVNDYNDWTSLGEGGIEHGAVGWLTVTGARLLKKDPHDTRIFSEGIGKPWDVKTLKDLPRRDGSRPKIARHPVPHRQLTQIGDRDLADKLHAKLKQLALNDARLEFKTSHTEKHNDALWVSDSAYANPAAKNQGEIAHVHEVDGSVHVILSPSDARTVLESQWGELHPLAGIDGLLPPSTYVLLYSPRNALELAVHEKIVVAAIAFAMHR